MKFIYIALLLVLSSQMTLKSHEQISPFAGKTFVVDKIIREVPNAVGTAVQFAPDQLQFAIRHATFVNYQVGENNSFSTSSQSWEQQDAQRNDYGDYLFLIEYLLSISHHYTYEDGILAFSIQPNQTTLIELKEFA